MNLELTDEQLALRDTVRKYLSERAGMAAHVRPMLDDPTGTTAHVWRGLVDLGTTSLLVPADRGGDGMSMVDAGIVCEELGAALHPGPWLTSAVAAPRALTRFNADGAQARALFSAIAAGSTVAAVAISAAPDEFGACPDGNGVTLHGEINRVPDAAAADVLLVVGHGPRAQLYVVERNSPGVAVDEAPGIDHSRKQFRVAFGGARAAVVAGAEQGGSFSPAFSPVEALVDDMVVAWGADALGAASTVLAMAVEYAKVRRQFGAPIGSFQAVAHMCADMYETVELARSGIWYALWAADHADHTDRHAAALRVKAFAGELASVGDTAIQVFGGIGFTWEHDAQLYLKRLLSFTRFLGSADDALEETGRRLAQVHRAHSVGSDTVQDSSNSVR